MKILKKYKGFLVEWSAFTLIFFFLYDVIWAIVDFEDFKDSKNIALYCLWTWYIVAFFL